MGTVFSLAIKDTDLVGFEVYDHENERGWMAPDYQAALDLWKELDASPHGWSLSARYDVPDHKNVQMALGNARDVLEALGLKDQPYGSIKPEELMGRCLIGMALAVDVELPHCEETGESGARVIHLQREAGYVRRQISRIMELCELAIEHDRDITW